MDKAQRLFAQQPRPDGTIESLLESCLQRGSDDYRIYMFQGVMARDQDRLDDATAYLEKAHRLQPREISPLLELAFTLERRNAPRSALALYDQALGLAPDSRPAQLGKARLLRGQYRLEEARAVYVKLLQKDPDDPDALNGLAWVASADKRFDDAQHRFEEVLARRPDNGEAKTGLAELDGNWRYQLDVLGGFTRTQAGTAWNGGAALHVDLDAESAFEITQNHFSNELPSAELTNQTPLPSNDVGLAYYAHLPDRYNFSVSYDYRDHADLPTEHWLSVSGGGYLSDTFQWTAGLRQSFGASQWDNRLEQAGLLATLDQGWELVTTLYFQQYKTPNALRRFTIPNDAFAFAVDVNRQGPGKTFINVGAGYSPDLSNTDLHTRWVVPVGEQTAFLLSLEHVSVNREWQASLGWRFYWK